MKRRVPLLSWKATPNPEELPLYSPHSDGTKERQPDWNICSGAALVLRTYKQFAAAKSSTAAIDKQAAFLLVDPPGEMHSGLGNRPGS